jgi:transposase
MSEEAPQREVTHGLRWIVRAGVQRWMMSHDQPPWSLVYRQTQKWLKMGVFEAIIHNLQAVLRLAQGRQEIPELVSFLQLSTLYQAK